MGALWDSLFYYLTVVQERLIIFVWMTNRLLKKYRTLFKVEDLGEHVFDFGYGGNPAKVCSRKS